MIFKHFTWWDIAEYLSIFALLIILLTSNFLEGNLIIILVFVIVLILISINRKLLENRNKKRIAAALNIQLKKFSEQVENINIQVEELKADKTIKVPQIKVDKNELSDDKIIASLQKDLESVSQSVTTMANYIKSHNLDQRMVSLEQKISYLTNDDMGNYPNQIKFPDTQSVREKPPALNVQTSPKIAWKCLHIIDAHQESVTDLVISYDKQYLLSVSWDQYLKLWSLKDGLEVDRIQGSEQGLLTVATNKNNYLDYGIATGSLDQHIKIWSLVKGRKKSLTFQLEYTLSDHTGSVHGLEIAPENDLLVSGSYDQTIKKWDLKTGRLNDSSYDDNGAINTIALNDKIGIMVSGGGDGTISVWEVNNNKKLGLLVGNLISLESLSISKSGEYVAGGCADGTIKIWYLPPTIFDIFQEVQPSLQLQGHHGQVMDLLFDPNDELLYSGGVDGLVKIWYCTTGKELGHLKISEDNRIFSLALSEDGETLAAGGVDGTIKIWQQTRS